MKIKRLLPVLISLLNSNLQAQGKEVLLDRLCVVVDSDPIFLSEIRTKVQNGPLVKFSSFPVAMDSKDEFARAENDAINGILIRRKAEDLEIQPTDEQIETQITQRLQSNHGTREQLNAELAREKISYEQYKKDIRDQMILWRFKGRVIIPAIKISDRDVENHFLKKQGSTPESAEVSLRKIVVPIENNLLGAEKEKLANEIYEKLKSGLPFDEAQKLYANGEPSSVQIVQVKDLAPSLFTQIKDLKVGEFTRPIRLGAGFTIFSVSDKRLIGSQEFSRQKPELERELHELEVMRQTDLWLQTERNRAKIAFPGEKCTALTL